MVSVLTRYNGETYALMRVFTGLLFVFHGTQKLLGFPAPAAEMPDFVLYGAGTIELVGGVLVALGLFTRWAAFVCSGLMAFAYWMAHGSQGFWPLLNRGELAVIYCFVFLYIAAQGGGKWSLDAARGSVA